MPECSRTPLVRILPALIGCAITVFALAGCEGHSPGIKQESTFDEGRASAEIVSALTKPILFQPMFIWATSKTTYQGTGFFVRAPNNMIAAVTSVHFLETDGPPLTEVRWLEIPRGTPVATFTDSWGLPGNAGTMEPTIDLRPDYLLMPAPGGIPADLVLELDPRERLDVDERIWFPNKTQRSKLGYEVVEGTVIEADLKYSLIVLERAITLESQSGSPIVSQQSGKVVGILSRGGMYRGKTALLLTPAHGILKVLTEANEFPRLQDVIGKYKP